MSGIVRNKVKKAFHDHAHDYDSLARVQRRVVEHFVARFFTSQETCKKVLDIGAGTGALFNAMRSRFTATNFVGADLALGMTLQADRRFLSADEISFLCADAESLPFKEFSFDVVVSTSTLQWLDPLEVTFSEVLRVLAGGGRFCFAMFGGRTLFELRNSYELARVALGSAAVDRSHVFATKETVLQALSAAGFVECTVEGELEVEHHADVTAMLHSVKGIGAGSASGQTGGGLSGRSLITEMKRLYALNYGVGTSVPATYEVYYGSGIKP